MHGGEEVAPDRSPFTSTASSNLPPASANWLLRLAERLTYRQLLLLSIFGRPDLERFAELDARIRQSVVGPEISIVYEMEDLAGMRLLGIRGDDGIILAPPQNDLGSSEFLGVPLERIKPMRSVWQLVEMMELERVPSADRSALMDEFDPSHFPGEQSEIADPRL